MDTNYTCPNCGADMTSRLEGMSSLKSPKCHKCGTLLDKQSIKSAIDYEIGAGQVSVVFCSALVWFGVYKLIRNLHLADDKLAMFIGSLCAFSFVWFLIDSDISGYRLRGGPVHDNEGDSTGRCVFCHGTGVRTIKLARNGGVLLLKCTHLPLL